MLIGIFIWGLMLLFTQEIQAQCSGVFRCGRTNVICDCSTGGTVNCNLSNVGAQCNGTFGSGTCGCDSNCDVVSGGNITCTGSTALACEQPACTGFEACVETNYCLFAGSSGGGGGGGGGSNPPGCSPSEAGTTPFDCGGSGLYGAIFDLGTRKIWEGFSCGPLNNPPAPAASCGWWNGYWNGYFVAPQEGYYQFLAKVFPQGYFGIDVNQDGVVNACPNALIWGDRMVGINFAGDCNIAHRPKWAGMIITGTDPNNSCGYPGCDCWQDGNIGSACDYCGRHGQESDINTTAGNSGQAEWWTYNPLDGTYFPWNSTYPGLTEADEPLNYPRIPPFTTPLAQRSGSASSDECIYNNPGNYKILEADSGRGYVYVWVRRYLTAGSHRVAFTYNYNYGATPNATSHSMDFWYKGPSDNNFILARNQSGASCPFQPCDTTCTEATPTGPVLNLPLPVNDARISPSLPNPPGSLPSVTLGWAEPSNWGKACPTDNKSYWLCVGTTEVRAGETDPNRCDVYGGAVAYAGATQTFSVPVSVPLIEGEDYYWRVKAINGAVTNAANSSIGKFTMPFRVSGEVFNDPLGDCGGNVLASPATGFTGLTIQRNDGTLSSSLLNSFNMLKTYYSDYRFTLSTDGPGYTCRYNASGLCTQVSCNSPFVLYQDYVTSVPHQSLNNDLYISKAAIKWFQINYGDGGAMGGDIVNNIPIGRYFLGPVDDSDSSGLAMASGNISVSGAAGTYGPPGRLWAAEGVTLRDSPTNGWFGYFERTFDQAFLPTDSSFTSLTQASFSNPNLWTEHNEEVDSFVVYVNGNLSVDGDITVLTGEKYTVFVKGNLTVNSPTVNVTNGGFLGFVVQNDIIFSPDVLQVEGVFISDDKLTINTFDPSDDDQFVGEGIFVGMDGVDLFRDLDPTGTTMANNAAPAEMFNYRPDLLYNAPLGFKRVPLQWQEIEPTGVTP